MSNPFGWSYPPGAEHDPNAPYNQKDPPCEVCNRDTDRCVCPECPTCGEVGNPACWNDDAHLGGEVPPERAPDPDDPYEGYEPEEVW